METSSLISTSSLLPPPCVTYYGQVFVPRHLDSSLIDVDVHPTYVSIIIKTKVNILLALYCGMTLLYKVEEHRRHEFLCDIMWIFIDTIVLLQLCC